MKNKRTNFNLSKQQLHRNVLDDIVFEYFEENNLGFSKYDSISILRYRVYTVFDNIIYKRVGDFDMNNAIKELRKVLPQMRKLLNQCNDGSEPYGTDNDYGNLCYVSDRWMSEGRLRWLIQLAERNWAYKKVPEKDYPDQMTWEKVEV